MQQAKAQVAQENATKEIGLNKRAADLDIREMKFGAEQQIAKLQGDVKVQGEEQARARAEQDIEHKRKGEEEASRMTAERSKFEQEKAEHAVKTVESVKRETAGRDEALAELVKTVAQSNAETQQLLGQLVKQMSAKKRIHRDGNGRVEVVESVA